MAKDIHAQPIPLPKFPMSAFDLGYSLKTCSSMGRMNCHYVEEVIPSDIAHIKTDVFIRLDPLTFPIMHKVKVRQNFFFVPDRIILGDDMQEEFFSCKDMGAKIPTYSIVPDSGWDALNDPCSVNSLFDQMECQPFSQVGSSSVHLVRNPIPFLCYHKVFADYYADEILQQNDIIAVESLIDNYRNAGLNGNVIVTPGVLHPFRIRYADYSKDRFTSAQPDAQRVGEVYLMNPLNLQRVDGQASVNGNLQLYGGDTVLDGAGNLLRASLSIDELWDEMAVQRFLNSLNEFGNERYIEILAGQFGVLSKDARLQRSQWIGGNEMVVNVSEVLQTSETTSSSPLGALGGRGIVAGRGRDIVFHVPEHGYIIGILTIVPENGYASGSPRWLYKQSPLDFAMPRFNNLGEQAVLAGELYSDHITPSQGTNDMDEFGYQPQYDEYRSHPSRATGDFRESQFLAWHLDRKFTSVPPLNSAFLRILPYDTNRIFNDTDPDANHFRIHAFHKAMYVRPISKHPVPGKL